MPIERDQSREYPVNIDSSSEEEGTHAASRSTRCPNETDFEALIAPLRQAVKASTLALKRAQKDEAKANETLARMVAGQKDRTATLRAKVEKAFQAAMEGFEE